MFRLLYVQSFPKTNNQPIFITHSGKIFKEIRRPLDTTLEVNHVHFITSNIGIDSLVKLFLGVLQEKKIIILGSSLAEVSTSVESLSALLSPFVWQHTLVSGGWVGTGGKPLHSSLALHSGLKSEKKCNLGKFVCLKG